MARVLFVINNAAFFVSHRLPIALAAQARGDDVFVASPPGDGVEALNAAGVTHVPFFLNRGGRRVSEELRALWSLGAVIAKVQPDLIHAITIKPVLYAGFWSRLLRVPANVSAVSGLGWVFLSRGFAAEVRRSLVRIGYRVALGHPRSRVILQNDEDRAALAQAGVLRDERARMVRGSGVDVRRFAFVAEPVNTPPIVMLASRLLIDKGVRELVAAARQLAGRARFVLVGDIDLANPAHIGRDEMDAWISEGVIEWWGQRNDMPAVLAQANLVVLPSYREGLPKVLLEAGAVGRAIVTTDVPGCRDAILPGETGLLVAVRDADALAQAIAELLEQPKLRADMGLRGRAYVEAEHAVERVVAETLRVYDEVLGEA